MSSHGATIQTLFLSEVASSYDCCRSLQSLEPLLQEFPTLAGSGLAGPGAMTWMLIYLIRENIMLVYENPELAGILCLAVTVIVASFYASVAIYNAHASSLGKPLTLGGALREGLLSWPWLLGARLALAASLGIGFILLILPGIYLLIRLSLVESMAAVNRAPANETLGRSMEFTKGHFWAMASDPGAS